MAAGFDPYHRDTRGITLWAEPFYRYDSLSGDEWYHTSTSGFSAGAEKMVESRYLLGVAFLAAWPEYRSQNARTSAESVQGTLYAGAVLPARIEIGISGGIGYTDFKQRRTVDEERYTADFGGNSAYAGVYLGRLFNLTSGFNLRPFAAYDFLQLRTAATQESTGTYALHFDSHTDKMHMLRTGLELEWRDTASRFVRGRIYYSGTWGDRPDTDVTFVEDVDGTVYTSRGYSLERHMLGLGLKGGIGFNNGISLSALYDLEIGEDRHAHRLGANVAVDF